MGGDAKKKKHSNTSCLEYNVIFSSERQRHAMHSSSEKQVRVTPLQNDR